MAKSTQKPPPAGITLSDIVYVLFKHKWKILILSLLALAGAGAYYFRAPVLYRSEAKLLVRYVLDRSTIDQVDTTATPGGSRGNETVMVSQLAILTSWDLARQVAQALNPDLKKRLGPVEEGQVSDATAIGIVFGGINATAAKGSNVIMLSYKHRDPTVASGVLDQVVQQYRKKHLEIYRSAEAAEMVIDRVEKSATSLKTAESTLSDLRKRHGVLSLTEAMSTLSAELARGQTELSDSETRLAEQQARVAAIEKLLNTAKPADAPTPKAPAPATPAAGVATAGGALPEPGTEVVAAPEAAAPAAPPTQVLPDGQIVARYQLLLSRLTAIRATNVSLLARFTPENEAVKVNQAQLDQLEAERRALEKKHPELAAAAQVASVGNTSGLDLLSERAALAAVEARTLALRERLDNLTTKVEALSQAAPALSEAERTREIEDGNYKYMRTSQEKALIDQALAKDSNAPNISIIQAATPASRDVAMRDKIALGIAGGGPAAVIGLVLLTGLLFNRTIKRPAEFEEKLGLPLMMAIPYFKRLQNGQNGKSLPQLKGPKAGETAKLTAPEATPPPWDPGHSIRPHAEAIRDRLGLYFETNGIDHKPKLIAVTGQTAGAGASTVASGIAAALSETGDGKVLLVDMGGTRGAAHPFFDGRPAPALSTAIRSSRGAEEAADNLFLAKADGSPSGAQSIGAARLSRLMPDLKASYFDYIIFDMPPLGNTSPTPAMAAFMDQVLVVVESETCTREEILRQHRDLVETHAKVSMVLNKVRPHGPKAVVGNL